MVIVYIALLIGAFAATIWAVEARIFLAIFHSVAFRAHNRKPVHHEKNGEFPASRLLEDSWKVIAAELAEVIQYASDAPRFHHVDRANKKISFDHGPAWRAIVLKAYDSWVTPNCRVFPKTFGLLKDLPSVSTAMFSILEPQTRIPWHTGKFMGILRYHLALHTPKGDGCFFEVDGLRYYWIVGTGILFDDTFIHSVTNDTNDYRIILFLDVKKRSSNTIALINRFFLLLVRLSPGFRRASRKALIQRRKAPGLSSLHTNDALSEQIG